MYSVTSDRGKPVQVPDVGEACATERLIEICRAFGMEEQAETIHSDPPSKPFVYDGCSGPAPERTKNGTDIRLACLLHDIEYYCAHPNAGDARERQAAADYRLALRMLRLGAAAGSADFYVIAVRSAGEWWPGAQWGYGRV